MSAAAQHPQAELAHLVGCASNEASVASIRSNEAPVSAPTPWLTVPVPKSTSSAKHEARSWAAIERGEKSSFSVGLLTTLLFAFHCEVTAYVSLSNCVPSCVSIVGSIHLQAKDAPQRPAMNGATRMITLASPGRCVLSIKSLTGTMTTTAWHSWYHIGHLTRIPRDMKTK
jgi:hypothetical protein